MSISGVNASQSAALSLLIAPGAAGSGTATAAAAGLGSGEGALIANLDEASSGVSAAIQSLSSVLGGIIDTTA